ncbi:H-NS histone family protein [Marivita geojedonensis]|uniref:DNA-binding protein n=1 Tax=Marivita geojedonensis TaxID=1123756 RepID=A0A1X4NPZ9_9RHOB|nr:H-NS histone family protein [Marivita geojedonensis]OSQ53029.1 DNA-binding protein [Marivita geojedonensis]PRY82059.1 DNA-binding protein H-NS [Marivita geojedonensis]
MSVDLNNMSKDELKQLIKDAEKALKTLEARRLSEAKKAAESAAKEYGFSLDELLGGAPQKKGSKSAPKYKNPADASQTWTGKGRKPNWVIDALAAGKTMEDLKI